MKNFINIFDTEEEQVEKIQQWLKNNVLQIVIGIGLGFGGIWGWGQYKIIQQNEAVSARTNYLKLAADPKNTQLFSAIKNDYKDSDYAEQAVLLMAKQNVADAKYDSALQQLLSLTKSKNPMTLHASKLRIASIYLQLGDFEKALAMLEIEYANVFEGLYNHLKGDVYLAMGKLDLAKENYLLALKTKPNQQLAALIQAKISDLN